MTPEEMRAALDILGWSFTTLADKLHMNERQIRRWNAGTNPVPERVAGWLQHMVALHEANPPPAAKAYVPKEK